MPLDQPDLIDRRPRVILTRTHAEFGAVCARVRAGDFRWSHVEAGIKVGEGRAARRVGGWTWYVYYPVAK